MPAAAQPPRARTNLGCARLGDDRKKGSQPRDEPPQSCGVPEGGGGTAREPQHAHGSSARKVRGTATARRAGIAPRDTGTPTNNTATTTNARTHFSTTHASICRVTAASFSRITSSLVPSAEGGTGKRVTPELAKNSATAAPNTPSASTTSNGRGGAASSSIQDDAASEIAGDEMHSRKPEPPPSVQTSCVARRATVRERAVVNRFRNYFCCEW